MKHFQIPMLLFMLCVSITSRAQTALNYPDKTFRCDGTPSTNIIVKISYAQATGKLELKVDSDTASSVVRKKEDAEKFLVEKTRHLLLKNCPAISPGDHDNGVAVLARDAADYFLNNGIVRKDSLKLADNKELRLYFARGSYYLSAVNPLSGANSDLLKKTGGEYAFDIPNIGREKLVIDKILEFLGKHAGELKAPKVYLLPSNKLYIRNPEDSSITYAAADSNYLKKIKGGKADDAALAGVNQTTMFNIKTVGGEEPEPAKPEGAKPPAVTAKEVMLDEDSITCKADSSFSLAAFTYPKALADSFKVKAVTAKKELKEKVYSLQVMEAEFVASVEQQFAAGCTDANVKRNIAKFLKGVKKKIDDNAKLEKANAEISKRQEQLNQTIDRLASEKDIAVKLIAKKDILLKPVPKNKSNGQSQPLPGNKTLEVESAHLIIRNNTIYELVITGKVDGKNIQPLVNDQYGLGIYALIKKGQQLTFQLDGDSYVLNYDEVFDAKSGSAGISKELRDGEYICLPGDTVLIQQKRLLDYVSASAFIDLQAFNADNPNKNIATELYFNYQINPHNATRGLGFLKSAYLPITLGFNLFKQGEGMPTYRQPVTADAGNPASDTISYQYYFKNLDLYKYAFMQVRPMLNFMALDFKKRRLLAELNGGFLLMGSNTQINDPAKGVDSSYSKPVYSYSWLLESRIRLTPRPRYGLDLHVIYSFGLRPFSTDMKSATGDFTIQELGKANRLGTNKDDFIIGELNFYFDPRNQKSETDKGGLYFKLNWYKSMHYSDGHFMFLVGYSTDIKNFFR